MSEKELSSKLEAMRARQEADNARVLAFANRPDLGEMSRRERGDAYAEVMRPQNIEMLEGFERMGWMAPRADRHASVLETFLEFGFKLEPANGWERFLFELDLIFVQFDVPDTRKGHAQLKREVDVCIAKLEALRSTFLEFNHSIDFSVAAMLSKAETNDHIPTVDALIKSHKTVSAWLSDNSQAPRWREKTMRNSRVELATKLLTIFHSEFGKLPKPDGGSTHVPLQEANDWQRFFQGCAFIRLSERETPDRQAILWEAYGNW